MLPKSLAIALGSVILVYAAASAAQDGSAFYAGASIGKADAKDACNGLPGATCESGDTVFGVLVGYRFHPRFSAELGYRGLGMTRAQGGGVTNDLTSRAFELVGVGTLPLQGAVSGVAKLGFYRSSSEVQSTAPASNANTRKNGLTFGLGAQYDFNRNFAARAEFQRYRDVGGGSIGVSDVDVIGVTGLWSFR